MSRHPSSPTFEANMTYSLRPPVANTRSFLDAYNYRKHSHHQKSESDFSNKANGSNSNFDQTTTPYSSNYSDNRRLPQVTNNMRETFAYSATRKIYDDIDIPSPMLKTKTKLTNDEDQNLNSQINSTLRQTMDLATLRKNNNLYSNHLQRSVSGLNLGQHIPTHHFVKSDTQIITGKTPISFSDTFNQKSAAQTKSYNHLPTNQNRKLGDVQDKIKQLKQQRLRRKMHLMENAPNYHKKSNTTADLEEENERFTKKKSYPSFYTPKIQKNSNPDFSNTGNEIDLSLPFSRPALATNSQNSNPNTNSNTISVPDQISFIDSPRNVRQLGLRRVDSIDEQVPGLNMNFKQSTTPIFDSAFRTPRKAFASLDDFIIGKKLGHGKFGTAYMVLHRASGGVFALKKIEKAVILENKLINQFILQVKLQSYLNHQFIIKVYGVFDDETHIYIVMEFLQQGTLFNYLKKYKKLPENDVAQKIKYLSVSIDYLQERGIAHRDIKPQNIIMTNVLLIDLFDQDVCKLADFGWATFCDQERRKTYCGTCDYVAPQILQGQEYDQTVDLWCIGVLAYELLTGRAPFYHMSRKETMRKIINVNLNFPEYVSNNAKSFIQKLIQKNPMQRMSISEVLKHQFIKSIKLNE